MGFISRVRLLEANGYAARKNFVKKKYKDDTARKDIELRKINTRMEDMRGPCHCQGHVQNGGSSRLVGFEKCILGARKKEIFSYSDKDFLIKRNMSV